MLCVQNISSGLQCSGNCTNYLVDSNSTLARALTESSTAILSWSLAIYCLVYGCMKAFLLGCTLPACMRLIAGLGMNALLGNASWGKDMPRAQQQPANESETTSRKQLMTNRRKQSNSRLLCMWELSAPQSPPPEQKLFQRFAEKPRICTVESIQAGCDLSLCLHDQ